jgi:uncharacterized FAD-dependent dehydrogenase
MKDKYDLIVVGMGPSSIFLAYELIKLNKHKKILLIEQGKRVEKRNCPIEKIGKCVKCKPLCDITSGFSGAGAFSDGKLSLYNPEDEDIHVGGKLHDYIGVPETKKLIDYTDKIYLDFGADTKLEGVQYKEEVKKIYDRAKKEGINLIDIPIRHLGTEKAHELYARLENYLLEHIEMLFETAVADLIIEDNQIKGVKIKPSKYVEDNEYEKLEEIYADHVVLAVGRKGANWLSDMCGKYQIATKSGIVDIGVRYELPDAVMADINKYMYEGKFISRPGPFKDKVRTFCQNPSGFVSTEVYDNRLTLVNGHSYKERKSTNTNLAILVSHNFTHPFNKPIEYGRNIAENLNALGAGNILVQRLGDIRRGKRTWEHELERNTVQATLKSAVPGDITFAIGYRTMSDILGFIHTLDKVIEGFAHPDNLLYAPEIKFYSNQLIINHQFETSISGLYSIGDGGGMTRGLMMASCSGVQMARILDEKL